VNILIEPTLANQLPLPVIVKHGWSGPVSM